MKQSTAVKALAAMAHDGRLSLIRYLIQAGSEGLAAGKLAALAGVNNSTLSAQLLVLTNAGLVSSQRQGRSIVYAADYTHLGDLLSFLMLDCCCSSQDICKPLLEQLRS